MRERMANEFGRVIEIRTDRECSGSYDYLACFFLLHANGAILHVIVFPFQEVSG